MPPTSAASGRPRISQKQRFARMRRSVRGIGLDVADDGGLEDGAELGGAGGERIRGGLAFGDVDADADEAPAAQAVAVRRPAPARPDPALRAGIGPEDAEFMVIGSARRGHGIRRGHRMHPVLGMDPREPGIPAEFMRRRCRRQAVEPGLRGAHHRQARLRRDLPDADLASLLRQPQPFLACRQRGGDLIELADRDRPRRQPRRRGRPDLRRRAPERPDRAGEAAAIEQRGGDRGRDRRQSDRPEGERRPPQRGIEDRLRHAEGHPPAPVRQADIGAPDRHAGDVHAAHRALGRAGVLAAGRHWPGCRRSGRGRASGPRCGRPGPGWRRPSPVAAGGRPGATPGTPPGSRR